MVHHSFTFRKFSGGWSWDRFNKRFSCFYIIQEQELEKEMATHSGTLAWRIPWTGEPGGLQSMGSQRVGHARVSNAQEQGGLWFVLSPATLVPPVTDRRHPRRVLLTVLFLFLKKFYWGIVDLQCCCSIHFFFNITLYFGHATWLAEV